MKILVLALSGIGDALMFTPALKLLRQEFPSSQIDVMVMFSGAKEILENNSDLDNLIHFNFLKEGYFKSLKFIFSLRNKYDVTINVYPSNRKEYNLISFLIGANKRVAVRYLRMDNQNFGWLNNITFDEDDSLHNVQTNIRMIEKLLNKKFEEEPQLQLNLKSEELQYAENFLTDNQISKDDLVIGFHPGCATLKNHINRRWEPEKFAELGRQLIKNKNAKIFLFGGPDEEQLKTEIHKMINSSQCFLIKTDKFLQSIAIMKRCNLFVTNDSALMHIASALSLPVVAIIGPTNVNYIHPWKTKYKIASLNLECSPCFFYSPKPLRCTRDDIKFKCIKELTVEDVYSESKKLLEELRK
ncbi:MAG: glycosyltransferase family 9 protein [Ignavibacterium album]|uniref:glycosyltransferase family 9 protein n=1 Tax=Ignavibacterium album TaxID=591197 RepID=UPI0026F280FE|nr:glycosyltransferase family 9 protein [Ignavibacterium album]MCX8105469.1 glycosyltransferase family 9 protein [Ignavibacterium album]